MSLKSSPASKNLATPQVKKFDITNRQLRKNSGKANDQLQIILKLDRIKSRSCNRTSVNVLFCSSILLLANNVRSLDIQPNIAIPDHLVPMSQLNVHRHLDMNFAIFAKFQDIIETLAVSTNRHKVVSSAAKSAVHTTHYIHQKKSNSAAASSSLSAGPERLNLCTSNSTSQMHQGGKNLQISFLTVDSEAFFVDWQNISMFYWTEI